MTVSGKIFGGCHDIIAYVVDTSNALTRDGGPANTPKFCSRQLLKSDMYCKHLIVSSINRERGIGWRKIKTNLLLHRSAFAIGMGKKKKTKRQAKNESNTHLKELNVATVTLPAQKARQSFGMPRVMQHGVWLMLFTRHLNEILAHGAHTIKSAISLKSAFFGSHIRSRHVEWVIPFLMQQPRTSITSTATVKKNEKKTQKVHGSRQENHHLQSITEINFTTSAFAFRFDAVACGWCKNQ